MEAFVGWRTEWKAPDWEPRRAVRQRVAMGRGRVDRAQVGRTQAGRTQAGRTQIARSAEHLIGMGLGWQRALLGGEAGLEVEEKEED